MLTVVFLGTSAFAVASLKALASDEHFKVALVITQPDRPVGRKQTLTPPPVKLAAEQLGLKILQSENINKENQITNNQKPDFLVVVAFGQILSQQIIDWPTIAAVNVHGSLLPKLRGASPVHHAILQGFTETGVTVQRMVKELDAGPILSQTSVAIEPRETFATLHDKLAGLGAELLQRTLATPLQETEQDKSQATFCKKLSREDGVAEPKTMDAATIDRMTRALTPWPGVTIGGNKILETSLEPASDALPVACAKNTTLYVRMIQPPSGKPMSGKAFASGRTL